jgi:hypothetical protein
MPLFELIFKYLFIFKMPHKQLLVKKVNEGLANVKRGKLRVPKSSN